MQNVFQTLLNDGDEVIVLEPFFDFYSRQVMMANAKVVGIPFITPKNNEGKEYFNSNDWKVDYEALENTINQKTKIFVLTNPTNPFGKVFTKDELSQINLVLKRKNPNTVILSDEGNPIFLIYIYSFFSIFFIIFYIHLFSFIFNFI